MPTASAAAAATADNGEELVVAQRGSFEVHRRWSVEAYVIICLKLFPQVIVVLPSDGMKHFFICSCFLTL